MENNKKLDIIRKWIFIYIYDLLQHFVKHGIILKNGSSKILQPIPSVLRKLIFKPSPW